MPAEKPTKGRVIVTGIMFWYPLAGVACQFLHYLTGLRRLGYDAWYIEDSARFVYDPKINDFSPDASSNVEHVRQILEAHGFGSRWAFRGVYEGGRCYGMSESEILRLYRESDALLNVTGAQELREEHLACPERIYVESDPFAWQVRVAQGDQVAIDHLSTHTRHFTFGENLGAEDCDVPLERFTWRPTRQPVDLDLWAADTPPGETFTTVTTWRNVGKDIHYRGDTYYWTKDREFEKFLDLPLKRSSGFELATRVSPVIEDKLRQHGWRLADSVKISGDVNTYRRYIQGSRGEFTVARDQYVRPNTGWFSDRSVCYLAAGRPVITQETGFSKYVTSGRGLFGFRTMEDILAAVDAIESDPVGQGRAARDVAAEFFANDKVLASLLERAGL
jgi:hypothetical protein